MGALRHLLIVVVIGVVFRWLWRSSLNERASVEAGRTVFPATRAIRIFAVFIGVAFISLFLWSWFAVRKPDEWWVPYLFLGFLAIPLGIYPPVLSIEVDGVDVHERMGWVRALVPSVPRGGADNSPGILWRFRDRSGSLMPDTTASSLI